VCSVDVAVSADDEAGLVDGMMAHLVWRDARAVVGTRDRRRRTKVRK
jgi:hypothetical protein